MLGVIVINQGFSWRAQGLTDAEGAGRSVVRRPMLSTEGPIARDFVPPGNRRCAGDQSDGVAASLGKVLPLCAPSPWGRPSGGLAMAEAGNGSLSQARRGQGAWSGLPQPLASQASWGGGVDQPATPLSCHQKPFRWLWPLDQGQGRDRSRHSPGGMIKGTASRSAAVSRCSC